MKKFNKIIIFALIFVFMFPFITTGCDFSSDPTDPGGTTGPSTPGTGGNGGSGDSGGSGGNDSTGGETNPPTDVDPDKHKYVSFEDAITGVKTSFVVGEVDESDALFEEYVNNAIQNTQYMAQDILMRLTGAYFSKTNASEQKIDLTDFIDTINYDASKSTYLNGYNSVYAPMVVEPSDQPIAFDNIYNFLNELNEDYKFVNHQLTGTYALADGINIKYYVVDIDSSLNYEGKYDEPTGYLELKANEYICLDVVDRSGNDYDAICVRKIEETAPTYSQSQAMLNDSWNWFESGMETMHQAAFTNLNCQKFTIALFMILAGQTPYELYSTDYAEYLSLVSDLSSGKTSYKDILTELIKEIDHYGIIARDDEGKATDELKAIVQFVLNEIIGEDIIASDQEKIYTYKNNEYISVNSDYVYDYEKTLRYNNANLNKLNGNVLVINASNMNAINKSKINVTYDFCAKMVNQYSITQSLMGSMFSLDFANSSTTDEFDGEYSYNFAIDPTFKNYINTVEIIVSTVCSATKPLVEKDSYVYYAVPNIYEYIKAGHYYTNFSADMIMPSELDLESDIVASDYANFMPSGQQNYQSIILYSGTEDYLEYIFNWAYMSFESSEGCSSGIDLYMRYHKEDEGFVLFKNKLSDTEGSSLYKLNDEPIIIPKGTAGELINNGGEPVEVEIDFLTALSKRLTKNENQEVVFDNSIVKAYTDWELLKDFYENSSNCNKKTLVTGVNNCYKAVKLVTPSGEKIEVMGYDNLEEDYIEIIFAAPEGLKFNFAFYLTEMLETTMSA